ncbi:MAG: glycerate kinase [Paracoccus sp. (in: a-proteobacteria)]
MTELGERAMTLIRAGIAAADPAACVTTALDRALADPPAAGGRWHVIALGKAARAMAVAALAGLPEGTPALVITNAGNDAPLPGARVLTSGHPVPDAAGEAAAREVEAILQATGPDDRVLGLISGGGSAMLPAPITGLTLKDKQAVNKILLAGGADITETNLIRQSLSRLKGGGWLRASRASVTALILSDVPGDDLRVIASGPTVAPIGTVDEAAATARRLGIWDDLPGAVQEALMRGDDRGPLPEARNILIGSNAQSVAAMVAGEASAAPIALEGDVQDCAEAILQAVRDLPEGAAMAFGGETTVTLTGKGMGGRNQELALRFARLANGALPGDWIFASVGTDGRDGPGQAAGGLVGPGTIALIRKAGIDPEDALSRNDSTPALKAGGALVTTGPTGTNVADLAIFLRGKPA